MGMTGIPFINLNNGCASGSSALYYSYQAIRSGSADCVIALGFEKTHFIPATEYFSDRTRPLEKYFDIDPSLKTGSKGPFGAEIFANAALEHMKKYGTKADHFAKIAVKNHKHSVNNPYSI